MPYDLAGRSLKTGVGAGKVEPMTRKEIMEALKAVESMDMEEASSLLAESGLVGSGVVVQAQSKAKTAQDEAHKAEEDALNLAVKEFQAKVSDSMADNFKGKITIDFSGENPEAKIKRTVKAKGTSKASGVKRDILDDSLRAVIDANLMNPKAYTKLGAWLELLKADGTRVKLTGTVFAFRLHELTGGCQSEAIKMAQGVVTDGQIKGAIRTYPNAVLTGRIQPEETENKPKDKPKKSKK